MNKQNASSFGLHGHQLTETAVQPPKGRCSTGMLVALGICYCTRVIMSCAEATAAAAAED